MSLKFLYLGKKLHTYIALDKYDVCTMSRDVGRSEILGGGASYNVGWKIWWQAVEMGPKKGWRRGVRPSYMLLPTYLMSVTGGPEFQEYCWGTRLYGGYNPLPLPGRKRVELSAKKIGTSLPRPHSFRRPCLWRRSINIKTSALIESLSPRNYFEMNNVKLIENFPNCYNTKSFLATFSKLVHYFASLNIEIMKTLKNISEDKNL